MQRCKTHFACRPRRTSHVQRGGGAVFRVGTIRTHGQRPRCPTQMRTRAAPARPTLLARRQASKRGTRRHLQRDTPPAPAHRVDMRHPILHQSLPTPAPASSCPLFSSCQHWRQSEHQTLCLTRTREMKGGNIGNIPQRRRGRGIGRHGTAMRLSSPVLTPPPLTPPLLPSPKASSLDGAPKSCERTHSMSHREHILSQVS